MALFAFAIGCFFAALFFRDLVAVGRLLVKALFLFSVISCQASVVTDGFLDRLAHVESNNRANAIGDHGQARGAYQIKRVAWADVNRKQKTAVPFSMATNAVISRQFARSYLGLLESYLAATTRKPVSPESLYCAWNLGPRGFRRCGFSLKRCPKKTRRAAEGF